MAALNILDIQDAQHVQEMTEFFERNEVAVEDIKSIKNSCLHRIPQCVSASFMALTDIASTLLGPLPPLHVALLATQARDILHVPMVLVAFKHALLATKIVIPSKTMLFQLLTGVVRLTNAIVDVINGGHGQVDNLYVVCHRTYSIIECVPLQNVFYYRTCPTIECTS